MMHLIGLGNPGAKYTGTRHNAGFDLLNRLSSRWQLEAQNIALVSSIPGAMLYKPQTYMNGSGITVKSITMEPSTQLLVVVDDFALPLGTIRLRPKGSAGGHNGLKSIEAELGTSEYARLRIGIGAPAQTNAEAILDHVLGKFLASEVALYEQGLDLAEMAARAAISKGLNYAMNQFNGMAQCQSTSRTVP